MFSRGPGRQWRLPLRRFLPTRTETIPVGSFARPYALARKATPPVAGGLLSLLRTVNRRVFARAFARIN